MDIKDPSLEMPTLISTWQLPRRFDAVVWFVRIQRENPSSLGQVRLLVPQMGPALLQTADDALFSKEALGENGELLLSSGVYSWHGHNAYLESLSHWLSRHPPDWPASASLTWILCLHRDAWLAVAQTWLSAENTSRSVKSAWLILALGSADNNLLSLIPEDAYEHVHAQIYADEAIRGLQWLEVSRPNELSSWLSALTKKPFFKMIWSRFSIEQRLKWSAISSDALSNNA